MNQDLELCPVCESEDLSVVQQPRSVRAGVSFVDELTVCASCGEPFYTFDQAMASSRARAAAIRKADRLPSPDQIREARIALGMTQPEFEAALGVGKKTVTRWEKGTVPPSAGARGMLWLAVNHPATFLEYAGRSEGRAQGFSAGAAIVAHIQPGPTSTSPPEVFLMAPPKEMGGVRATTSSATVDTDPTRTEQYI